MSVKILSDFDGVWTDQAFEAQNVKLFLAAEAARLAHIAADAAHEHFARFERTVKSSPHLYGWAPDGRITAYVDEDPFCDANRSPTTASGATTATRAATAARSGRGHAC